MGIHGVGRGKTLGLALAYLVLLRRGDSLLTLDPRYKLYVKTRITMNYICSLLSEYRLNLVLTVLYDWWDTTLDRTLPSRSKGNPSCSDDLASGSRLRGENICCR